METSPYILRQSLRDEAPSLLLPAVVLFAGDLAACEQVVAKVGGSVTAFFGNSVTLKHFTKCREDDFHVAKEGDFLNVFKIVADFSFPCHCVTTADLRESAKSLSHGVTLTLFRGHKDHVTHKLRPRPDYGHVALEDVEEFGQLVEAGGAEELAVFSKAHIVREQVAVCVLLVGHGAELDKIEDFLILAGAGLRKEGVALHLERTDNGQQNQERAQAEDRRESTEEVQNSLEEVRVHYATALDGTMSLPFGSVIPMQAWLRHSG